MNKAETYCYVIREQLKNRKARICLYYSNQNPNPKERIEVKKSGDLKKDLQNLLRLVENELPKKRTVSIEKEKEICTDGAQKTTIDKFFICVQ